VDKGQKRKAREQHKTASKILVAQTCNEIGCSPYQLFQTALTMDKKCTNEELQYIYSRWVHQTELDRDVENFCIDVLAFPNKIIVPKRKAKRRTDDKPK